MVPVHSFVSGREVNTVPWPLGDVNVVEVASQGDRVLGIGSELRIWLGAFLGCGLWAVWRVGEIDCFEGSRADR